MADTEKVLKLLIELGYVGKENADKVHEALQNAKTSTADIGEAQKSAATETEKFTLSQREAGHVLREIGEQALPGAGRALGELRLGLLGVALAAGSVFEGIREQIKKTSEELDEMAARAAQTYANVKANLFDAIRAEEFPTDKIDRYFEHFSQGVDRVKQFAEAQARLQEASLTASERVEKANEDLALAQLRARGDMTPEQKAVAEAAIKQDYAGRALQNELAKNQIPVTQAAKDLETAQNAQSALEIQKRNLEAASDRERVEKAMASPDVDQGLKAEYERQKAAGAIDYSRILGEANAKNAEQTIASLKEKLGLDEKGNVSGGDAKALANAREHLETMERLAAGFRATDPASAKSFEEHQVKDARDAVERGEVAVKLDKQAIQQAETQLAVAKQTEAYTNKLNTEIAKLGDAVAAATAKLQQAHAIAEIQNQGAAAAAATTAAAGAAGALKPGITAVYQAEYSHFQEGHALTQAQGQTIVELRKLLDQAHQNSTAILNLIIEGVRKHESLDQIIRDVQAQMQSGVTMWHT